MRDVFEELSTVRRVTGRRGDGDAERRTVIVRREYDAPVEEVWDAISDPDRISRWFLPVTGDLRLGGTFQLEGNAGGRILRCEPPRLLGVSWVLGDDPDAPGSEVQVRLSPGTRGGTVFELEHAVPVDAHWNEYGPGAVGVGWDLTLLGLSWHLAAGRTAAPAAASAGPHAAPAAASAGPDAASVEPGEPAPDPAVWMASTEARAFMTASSNAWGEALRATGAAGPEVARMVGNTTAAYVPPTPPAAADVAGN